MEEHGRYHHSVSIQNWITVRSLMNLSAETVTEQSKLNHGRTFLFFVCQLKTFNFLNEYQFPSITYRSFFTLCCLARFWLVIGKDTLWQVPWWMEQIFYIVVTLTIPGSAVSRPAGSYVCTYLAYVHCHKKWILFSTNLPSINELFVDWGSYHWLWYVFTLNNAMDDDNRYTHK